MGLTAIVIYNGHVRWKNTNYCFCCVAKSKKKAKKKLRKMAKLLSITKKLRVTKSKL